MLSRVLLFALLVAPLSAQAQLPVDPLTITLTPSYPRPYDTVTITVGSTAADLASGTLTITADGTVIGENTRSAQLTLGGPGSRTLIKVVATTRNESFAKQLTISPADVALVLEPQTTAPPFYEGARLVAPQAMVRLVAVPDIRTAPGTRVPASSLVYTWRLGNQILQGQSGIGKNVFTATAPVRYRDAQVSVTVATQDGSRVAQGSVVVSAADPIVRVYEDDPLLGPLFGRALLGEYLLQGDEDTFRAVAYHFGKAPAFAWTLNGTQSGTDETITVRTAGASAGTARLGVRTTGSDALENAEANLTLRFGPARGQNIFGF